jgi:dihydroorotase
VNESENTIHLGMKVRPSLAENIEVRRNIELLRYTGGAIHLTGISSKESVQAVREAKAEGLNVSADSAISNVVFTDKDYSSFDSAWKVLPMLRTKDDAKSILEGLEDGTIDFVSSHHEPKDIESKDLEFDRAAFGISSIETLFSSWSDQSLDTETLIKGLSENTREVFDLNRSEIKEGEKAELTLFSDSLSREYSSNKLKSKSKSSPYLNKTLKGSVVGVINGDQLILS